MPDTQQPESSLHPHPPDAPPDSPAGPKPWARGALAELALLFLKLGTIAFGGPAAHVAMMEDEVVRRRRWLTSQEFLDMLGATNLVPGPNSTEMAIHIGYRRAGLPGLLVAGSCFIVPATLIVTACAWAYVRYGQLPAAAGLLYGIKPVVIAIVVQALWGLGRTAIRSRFLAGVAVAAVALGLAGVHEIALLFGGAVLVVLGEWILARRRHPGGGSALLALVPAAETRPLQAALSERAVSTTSALASGAATAGPAAGAAVAASPVSLDLLFLVFLKIGTVLFGSGYVLLAFLRADFVERLGWMTETQLLDSVAVGQVTPGPLFTTATFIGYLLAGPWGAVTATVGIFLPAFFFVAVSAPFVSRMRQSVTAGWFLDGLNVASLALMAVVTWQLATAAIVDATTASLAALSAGLLFRFRISSLWLIALGAAVGLGLTAAGFLS